MIVDVYLRPVPAGSSGADPWLYDPTAADSAALPRDDRPPRGRQRRIEPTRERGRIEAVSLYNDLAKRYGITDGHRIYWEMRDQRKGPFGKGKKYDATPRSLRRVRRLSDAGRRKPDA